MKKSLSTLIFIGLVFTSLAQNKSDSSTHIVFKGVPIDGTLAEFVIKMKNDGFFHKGTNDGVAMLEGEFASYKNCTIEVSTMKKKDLVSNISVIFPDRETWPSLSSNYFTLKELLTEKYGRPSESKEEFQSITPDSDGSKFYLVKTGECKYYTTYETGKGTIQLSIENVRLRRCFIKLVYRDKINSEVVKKQALDDL